MPRIYFNEEKATEAAAFLLRQAGGDMNVLKLVKLLYLAEREALLQLEMPIICDLYVAMPQGLVMSRTLDLINSEPDPSGATYWQRHITERQDYTVRLRRDPGARHLSRAELELLAQTLRRFGSLDQWQLRDHTHTLPEWKDPEGSSIPISIREILEGAGRSRDEAAAIEADLTAASAAIHTLS